MTASGQPPEDAGHAGIVPVVRSTAPVTLVGGAATGQVELHAALALAPALAAADGGAQTILDAGLVPLAVIGDMDSLSPAAARAFAGVLHPVKEQDTTDFDKALSRVEAPLVIAVGASGGRLDHELAALHALVLRADRPCLLLGVATLAFHCPPRIELPLDAGTTVSLFPFARVGVSSEGLRWPTTGLDFAPDRRVGTSNEALGTPPVRLAAEGPGTLVILPCATLPLAARALLAAPRWPSPPPPAPAG